MMKSVFLGVAVRLLTEKFLVAVLLHIAEHLALKSSNKLDDKLVAELKKALEE